MADFVSRAGNKLQFALDSFKVSVKDLTVADFGSSTGGFVDCLLQSGAKKVYSVDTAYGELAWKLRNDPRVVVMERTNAMHVVLPPPSHKASEGHGEKMDFITIDTSWTKQKHVLPSAGKNLKKDGFIISLVKPHYEAGKSKLTDEETTDVLEKVKNDIKNEGLELVNIVKSPILGEKGKNREFLALLQPIALGG